LLTSSRHTLLAILSTAALALGAAGCGSSDGDSASKKTDSAQDTKTLVVYSGREKELAEPIYAAFTKETGIKVEARYGESAAMAAQLQEEGDRTPADVFYSQDAGAIGVVEDMLTKLPAGTTEVSPLLRDKAGRWTGVTARVRTLVYNTDELKEADLPTSVTGVTDPKWKGRIGVAPTNASFIAFISAMRLQDGDAATKKFLQGLAANEPKIFEKNGAIVDAVGSGEIQIGLVNHYYLYEKLEQDPELPIANHYFAKGDIGNLVNVSAVGILKGAKHADEAKQFVDYMLASGQELVANELAEREYPVVEAEVEGNERYEELPPLADVLTAQKVDLSQLGDELKDTVALIAESGLAT
jgi:iron(III) transport system substrate-binding protein